MSNMVITPVLHFEDINGKPLVGGKLYSYEAGSSTPLPLYMDEALTRPHPDPIVLDMRGECKAFYDPSLVYKLVLKDSYENIIWEADHLTASGSGGGVSNIVIEGTPDEIEVEESTVGLVRRFVIKLSSVIKNKLQEIQDAFAGISEELNGKKDKQLPSTFTGSTTKTVTGVSQDENGELDVTFEDIEYPDYDAEIEGLKDNLYEDEKTISASLNDLNARLGSVEGAQGEKNIGDRTADSLDAQVLMVGGIKVKFMQAAKSLDGATDKTVTNISQDENGVITVTYSAIAFPDWTSAITAATNLCEKLANKKTTFTGNTSSDTFYPTIKAVVDYLDTRLQNLGGKLITDNGDPFASESVLPSTTPFQGQNILTNDYAYVQDSGLAARYTFTVNGSSVTWTKEYEISFPVFTTAQQNAIDSGITSGKVSGYDSHVANSDIHVTATQKTEWSGKQDALSTSQIDAVNSGITSGKVSGYDSHVENNDIHVTASQKTEWSGKQDAIADLSDIRDGASKGETAVQPEDLATYMTNPVEGGVIAAALNDLNARLNALEYEDDNIGDKIADKFDAQVLRCGGVDVKTKQAAKTSPSASGTSLAFIDSVSQNENGEITATKKNLPSATTMQQGVVQLNNTVTSTSQTQAATANVLKTTYDLANSKKDKQTSVSVSGSTTKTLVGITQNENGVISPTFDDISFPDWTSTINAAVAACEKLENKKTTVTSFESSNTYYPTIKAVVDFVNGMLQNLGGKLITDNGDPFTSSASLPSSTPYHGVDIADKDYAYVQDVGTAERWSATVSGSSVTWKQEYAISIPVFTPSQQAIIDGDGSDMTATFSTASSRTNISTGEKLSVILGKIAKWFADLKAVAFTGNYSDLSGTPTIPAAANNGVLTITQNGVSKGSFSANQSGNATINLDDTTTVSSVEKTALGQVDTLPVSLIVSSNFKAGTFLLKGTTYGGEPFVFGDVTIPNNQWYRFTVSGQTSTDCVITLEPCTGGSSSPFNIFKILVDNGSSRPDKVMKVVRVPYESTTSAVGDSSNPIYVDESGEIKECTSVAQKASSGSGNLAVIDPSGNYVSSGITAYSQTQYNNQTERLAAWLSSFTSMSHAFNVVFHGTQISKTISFENEFTGVKYLRLGISYFGGEIKYYLPFSGNSSEYNGWIISPDTSQKYGLSTMHSTHNFVVQGTSNNEELFDETELGTTGESVGIIFEKAINTSQTVRGRISSELRLINIPSNDTLFVHIDLAYERLSSNGNFYAFGTVFVNTEATDL